MRPERHFDDFHTDQKIVLFIVNKHSYLLHYGRRRETAVKLQQQTLYNQTMTAIFRLRFHYDNNYLMKSVVCPFVYQESVE